MYFTVSKTLKLSLCSFFSHKSLQFCNRFRAVDCSSLMNTSGEFKIFDLRFEGASETFTWEVLLARKSYYSWEDSDSSKVLWDAPGGKLPNRLRMSSSLHNLRFFCYLRRDIAGRMVAFLTGLCSQIQWISRKFFGQNKV